MIIVYELRYVQLLNHSFIYSLVCLFIYSFINLFIYSLIRSFINYSFIHLFNYLFIHSFIHSFVHYKILLLVSKLFPISLSTLRTGLVSKSTASCRWTAHYWIIMNLKVINASIMLRVRNNNLWSGDSNFLMLVIRVLIGCLTF